MSARPRRSAEIGMGARLFAALYRPVEWFRTLDTDLRLLIAVVLIVVGALATSFLAIRQVERHLLRTEATNTAIHWAELLQSRLRGLEEILAAGLVSDRDQRVFDFASAAGDVQDYQVIRPDGRVALSSWSGDFRGAIDASVIRPVLESERTVTMVVEETLAGERVIIGQAYVPLSAGAGKHGALKVDVDMTRQAERYRRLGNGALLALVALLLPPAGFAGWLVASNIRARRRAERLQRQRGIILEQLAKGAEIDRILRTVARFAERARPGATCTILTLDPSGNHVVAAVSSRRRERVRGMAGKRVDALPASFAASLRASAPSFRTTFEDTVWSTPLQATSGTRLGVLVLEFPARFPVRRLDREGPEETLAQLAALAVDARRAEDALVEMRERNELILSAAGDGILGVDAVGRITFANPAAARMLDRDIQDLIGRRAAWLLQAPPEECDEEILIDAALADGRARHISKTHVRTAANASLPVQMVVTPIPHGLSSLRAVVVFHDISSQIAAQRSLQRAKEEAEAASRSKSSFLAHMSHELRTPLNAIIGFSEVITAESLGPLDNRHYLEYAEHIHSSGQHLLALINDLLDLSKIEAGRLELWEETVDLGSLLERTNVFVADSAQSKGVVVEVRKAPDLPPVHCDGRKVKQILVNLLSNAVKFTPEGGRITLEAAFDGTSGVVLRVSDTGIGIAPCNMEKVMAPFGQADGHLVRDHQGTGLGLPLAKALVELHGGRFNLESTLGKGTTATVRLPGRAVLESPSRKAAG